MTSWARFAAGHYAENIMHLSEERFDRATKAYAIKPNISATSRAMLESNLQHVFEAHINSKYYVTDAYENVVSAMAPYAMQWKQCLFPLKEYPEIEMMVCC